MYDDLLQNVTELIYEQQCKLGYAHGALRLYYPLSSLNRLLKTDLDAEGMQAALSPLSGSVDALGPIAVTHAGERFCLSLGPRAADWVHENAPKDGFLPALIEVVRRHGAAMDDVLSVFFRFSDRVTVEQKPDAEFDVLAYFSDGVPDGFRYCFTCEGEHITYHRLTADDYHALYPAR